MEVFKVAPFDQILFLNGEYLNDNTQSLASLGVLPGSSIFLKVIISSLSSISSQKHFRIICFNLQTFHALEYQTNSESFRICFKIFFILAILKFTIFRPTRVCRASPKTGATRTPSRDSRARGCSVPRRDGVPPQ